jgi:Sensors of blue-light using FAD
MFSLVYVSSAVRQFSKAELLTLLEKSRENNTSLGISGMLLYKDGNFLQVLEGEEQQVRALYAKITDDLQHKGSMALLQGFENERAFPDWSMGFRDLRSPEATATPGFNDFLNVPLTTAEFSLQPGRAKKLLLLFKKTM